MMRRLLLAALLAPLLAGCYTQPRPLSEPPPPPRATTSATHYRALADAADLAAYLRYDPDRTPLVSAHRGGPGPLLPENALASFEYALNFAPALIETDVRIAADGALVLLHDETLGRTTTGSGPVGARTLPELRLLRLLDPRGLVTAHRIPTLPEALAWAEGRAVLMLDVKDGVPPERLVAAVREAGAENRVVVIAYTLDELLAYQDLAPDLNYSATTTTRDETDALLASGADLDRIIAFAGVGGVDPAVVEQLHAAGIAVQAGTFGEIDAAAFRQGPRVYDPLLDAGVDVLATDAVPVAALAVQRYRATATGR